jgi:hypothetical protein
LKAAASVKDGGFFESFQTIDFAAPIFYQTHLKDGRHGKPKRTAPAFTGLPSFQDTTP